MNSTTNRRPRLVAGHTYRITFTPCPERANYNPATATPYSKVITVEDPKVTRMWVNRWTALGKNTVEIVEVPA